MANDMEVPFLGRIPLDPRIARSCDEGKFYLDQFPESEATKAFNRVFQGLDFGTALLPVAGIQSYCRAVQ